MPQSSYLFREYLTDKAQRNTTRTDVPGSKAIATLQNAYCLKQGSFPTDSPSIMPPKSSYSSSKAQLTIFYQGRVYVYDNVPADKAKEILLLARESSVSNSATEMQSMHLTTPSVPNSSLLSICKLEGGIDVARKHSLMRFLDKRRARLTNKSTCGFPIIKQENGNPTSDDCMVDSEIISPATSLHI